MGDRTGTRPYELDAYPRFEVTVDIVILTAVDRRLGVLLIERGDATEQGRWALPGGFKTPDETLDAAARRELHEETSVRAPRHLSQLRAYGDPGRDPRGNVVTIAYVAGVPEVSDVKGGSDARDATVRSVDDVIGGKVRLAFDHRRIVTDARDHVRGELDRSDIALSFLGTTFTLSELREVHEAISGDVLDPANFRRTILNTERPLIEATGQLGRPGPGGGRPPELFRPIRTTRR